jgi:N-acetyl-gamma-glutamyl-phosphate reductase
LTARLAAPAPGSTTPRPASSPIARVALLGASGYTGLEFIRYAAGHPGVRLAALASREFAGRPAAALAPGVRHLAGADAWPLVATPAEALAALESGEADTLVSALPHGALKSLAAENPAWLAAPARLLDLSSDFRDGGAGFVYGAPEAARRAVTGAARVANPGCYPTAALLALLPALEANLLAGPVTVTALSGVTGAGRGPSLKTSFAELDGGARFYKVGESHAHVAEMRRNFGDLPVAFAPQLVPMSRGILLTAIAPLRAPMTGLAARDLYVGRYAGEPFVTVTADGEWPATHGLRGTNRAEVAVTIVHDGRTLLATCAIDNLGKGAAGQAIQNLNLMLGRPETDGLLPGGLST